MPVRPCRAGAFGLAARRTAGDAARRSGAYRRSRTRGVRDRPRRARAAAVAGEPGGRLLYSRGYSSILGEWATTEEARDTHRSFHESLRFPRPAAPVRIAVQ